MIIPYLNTLNKEECQEIIFNSSSHLQPAKVKIENGSNINSQRKAEGAFILANPPVIQKVKNIVSQVTNLPIENQEMPHVVRYKVGGEYQEHYDFFDIKSSPLEFKRGGNRKHSCLFYLNDNFEGGETFFPYYKLNIGPTTGTLLKWDNLLYNNEPNPYSKHSGLPITKGEKWILIIWVRENKCILNY